MSFIKHKTKGFTLLELIVTVSIITLLVVAGAPAFNSYARNNSTRIAAQDVKNYILEAQSLSQGVNVNDRGKDFYYFEINFSGNAQNNGKIEIGAGDFDNNGFAVKNKVIKSSKIDSEAWIEKVRPINRDNEDSLIYNYFFIVPTGQILFNQIEPYPGIGYSARCKINRRDCYYTNVNQSKSIIQLKVKGETGSLDQAFRQSVVIDGHGGDVEIIDGFINLAD